MYHGVNVEFDELHWGALGREGHSTSYAQHWAGDACAIESKDGTAIARINGREIFRVDCGVRVDTDWRGTVLRVINLRPGPARIRFCADGRETALELKRNEVFIYSSAR